MTIFKAACIALCAAAPAQALAEAAGDEIRKALGIFSEGVASLSVEGYSQIKMVDWQTNRFSAYDAHGSEVLLTLNPDHGTVERLDYVHPLDE